MDQRAGDAGPICPPWRCSTSGAAAHGSGGGRGRRCQMRHGATVSLQSYRVEVSGAAQVTTTRRRCCSGNHYPVRLAMDLTWTTAGTPYALSGPPPQCRILHHHGTIPVDGPQLRIEAAVRAARPLARRARLVEHGLGVERSAPRRRHSSPRCPTCASPTAAQCRLSARRGTWSDDGGVRGATFADDGARTQTRIVYRPGPVDTTIGWSATPQCDWSRRTAAGEPVPAGLGRWRPQTYAVVSGGRVEPQPLTHGCAGVVVQLVAAQAHRCGRRRSPPATHQRQVSRVSRHEQPLDFVIGPDPAARSAPAHRCSFRCGLHGPAGVGESSCGGDNPRAAECPRHGRPPRRCSRGCAGELRRHRASSGVPTFGHRPGRGLRTTTPPA